jgi:hypothetical protein
VVKLVILILNVLMLRGKIVMKKNLPRRKINLKGKTREETKISFSRKISTQRKIVPHHMKMMIATMTQKMYSLWILKMMKRTMKKKIKWILRRTNQCFRRAKKERKKNKSLKGELLKLKERFSKS